ncbi:MAG: GNAT family N-acetyltransferase [Pseudomonadota bacterium]
MTAADLAALHALAFGDQAWAIKDFTALMTHPGAILSADTYGFVLLRVVADECEVLTLATDPAHRRAGIATRHMTAAEEQARAKGATRIFLEVAADNTAARALYAGIGYTQVGQRQGYYRRTNQPAVDALILQKSLPSA